ncbi:MAG: efflux transporter outer membrane subunit [Pseudomonadota bacterium]
MTPHINRQVFNHMRKATLLVSAVALASCASVIDPVKSTEVNLDEVVPSQASWAEETSADLPRSDWVESFNDENLTALVNRARSDNPSLIRAMSQLDLALAQKNISRSELYPSLDASSSITRSEGGVGFNAGTTSYNIGLSTRWEVDVINRIRDQISSDGFGAEASAADLAALELSVVSRLATNWFSAIEAGLLVDLSADDIATQERSLRLTQRRFESGLTGSSDVRLARSAIANAQAVEQSRLQQRDATLRSVQIIVRDYPDANIALPDDLPALPAFTGAGTPERMLANRPDIIAAEKRIKQAGLDVDLARKALYPRLTLSGSAGDQALNSLGDILDLKSLAFSLTESITAPIFQGGRLKSQVEAQRAQLAVQVENYVETVLTAYQEVENALDAEERLAAREAALRIARDEAVMAEERLELRYTEGLATILQLLDSQTRRLNAEGQLISARSERLANRVRLHVALGGGGYTLPADLLETEPVDILGINLP